MFLPGLAVLVETADQFVQVRDGFAGVGDGQSPVVEIQICREIFGCLWADFAQFFQGLANPPLPCVVDGLRNGGRREIECEVGFFRVGFFIFHAGSMTREVGQILSERKNKTEIRNPKLCN